MRKFKISIALFLLSLSGIAQSTLTLNADRLVYKEKEGDASITIHSNEERAYLVQSWIDAGNSTEVKKLPFVVTPPLFRLAPKSDNVIRIMYLGSGLPTDRESLFWLDVKGVPGLNDAETNVKNRMVLAINNRIKFFFRPAGLKGEPGESVQNLKWTRSGNSVTVSNSSPFNLVLSNILVDNEIIPVSVVDNNTVIPAFGHKTYAIRHALTTGSKVEWDAINDFGVTSKKYTQSLN